MNVPMFFQTLRNGVDYLLGVQLNGSQQLVATDRIRPDRRTAWIISYTPVAQEPRLIRQVWSLHKAGWQVAVAGYLADCVPPPDWCILPLDKAPSRSLGYRALLKVQREVGRLIYRHAPEGSSLARTGANLRYFGEPNWREHAKSLIAFARQNPNALPQLIIAHDHPTYPAACTLAKATRASLMVDCHEYVRGQYDHDEGWRRDGRLLATMLQDEMLAQADAVTTVSEGIADRLNTEQVLRQPVKVLRSMPFYEEMPFRPTGDVVTVLYHGLLAEDRGLEALIQSVRFWKPHLRLILRGHGDDSMVGRLRFVAAEHAVQERITFEHSVPFDRIIADANCSDIGYFVQPDGSPQKKYTLPNKFFEYSMAGLALAVANMPEMARLVHSYKHGVLISELQPQHIAEVLNGLDKAQIDQYKNASLAAARELCWDREHDKFMAIIDRVMLCKA